MTTTPRPAAATTILLLLHLLADFTASFSSRLPAAAHHSQSRSLVTRHATAPRKDDDSAASFIKDMAASLFGGNRQLQAHTAVDQAIDSQLAKDDIVPSWTTIRSTLERMMESDDERNFRSNLALGLGIGSPLHTTRLYDDTKYTTDDIRVTFYRDSASWCPYCHKVWLALEEKQIPYRVVKVNMSCYGRKPMEFLQLQPNGQIPVAVIDGRVYGQSNDILQALEDLFPTHKSLQSQDQDRAKTLLRLERQLFSAWLQWLTGSARSKGLFVDTLERVESELSKTASGPFFMGDSISMVDIQFAPFLERMAASLLYFKGFMIRVAPNQATEYPCVNRWFDAMETLPSYQLTKSDYYTHNWDLPPQLGGCTMEAAGEPYCDMINGLQDSWQLPLTAHNNGIEPDWTWAGDEHVAKREAVERISANHDAIVKFAARGAGRPGMPPVSAPLADPNAASSDDVIKGVDVVVRVMCMALLLGTNDQENNMSSVSRTFASEGDAQYVEGVIDSLVYLRDRVGVPRDMKLPAARQLRAHSNWAIGKLLAAQQ